jgi:hypothetical protein
VSTVHKKRKDHSSAQEEEQPVLRNVHARRR